MNASPGSDIGIYHVCAKCEKRFYIRIPGSWTYKMYSGGKNSALIHFCSYTCSQAYKADKAKQDTQIKTAKNRGKQDIVTAEVLDDLFWNRGMTINEIAQELHVSRSTIDKYLNLYSTAYNAKGRTRAPKRMPRGE